MVRRMPQRKFSTYDHIPIHWLPEFKADNALLLRAFNLGYQIDRWNTPESLSFKYGVYKKRWGHETTTCGVFESTEEVVNLLKFLLATAEKEN